jgi:hypothetical protein
MPFGNPDCDRRATGLLISLNGGVKRLKRQQLPSFSSCRARGANA